MCIRDRLEAEVRALEETGRELTGRITALEQARSYENLSQENDYYLDLAGAEKEQKKHELRREKLAREISELEQGAMRELRERLEETKKRYALKEDEYTRAGNEFAAAERELGTIEADLRNQKAQHAEAEYGLSLIHICWAGKVQRDHHAFYSADEADLQGKDHGGGA